MATTYDKASLVMIPSGVKESKLYSIKPTSGDGDFTFSRGTDTATRVNASGLIEKERGNLLTYSNTFSNAAWTKSNSSVTGGQSGYDGSSDAWLLESTSTSGAYAGQSATTSGVRTDSVYAKAGNVNWVRFSTAAFGNGAYFDLQNGVVGTTASVIDAVIEGVGSGWYRLSITHIGTTGIFIFPAVANNTLTSTSGQNIYIQDAQLEYGLVATSPVIKTTTAAVYEGITDNLPRLDYSGGASCPSLLLEPSRTNVIAQSEYFGDSSWSKLNSIVSPNQTISPDGTLNAYKYTLDATSTRSTISTGVLSVGTLYNVSVFVKYDSVRYFYISNAGAGAYRATFDIENGTIVSNGSSVTSSKIESYGNGWYRCSAVFTAAYTTLYFNLSPNSNNATFTNTTDFGYIWGAQVESNASYPTSYIPTYGTSASRAGDESETSAISGLVSANGGSLFLEISYLEFNSFSRLSLSDGTSNNTIYSRTQPTTNGGKIQFLGGNLLLQSPSDFASLNTFYKVAIGFEENNAVLYIDGVQIDTDTSFTMPSGLDIFAFGQNDAAINPIKAEIKQVLVFPTRLTNAELAALTA